MDGLGNSDATTDKLLLTAREAARLLSVSERTLWSFTNEGAIPVVRIGRRVLYSPADLHAFIDANRGAARSAK